MYDSNGKSQLTKLNMIVLRNQVLFEQGGRPADKNRPPHPYKMVKKDGRALEKWWQLTTSGDGGSNF